MNTAVYCIEDLVYQIAHAYPGGIPALALRMDCSANVLNKKVNPTITTHVLTYKELCQIRDLADPDKKLINAECANSNGIYINTVNFDSTSDMALLDTYTKMMAKLGVLGVDINQALSDGEITKKELELIKQDYYNLQAAGATLIARLEALAS